MRDHGVTATFFVDVKQIDPDADPKAHLARTLGNFRSANWAIRATRGRDSSMTSGRSSRARHGAACTRSASWSTARGSFISSANFTQRGQERNIEVGVLIDDVSFASHLARQWIGLIDQELAVEWGLSEVRSPTDVTYSARRERSSPGYRPRFRRSATRRARATPGSLLQTITFGTCPTVRSILS